MTRDIGTIHRAAILYSTLCTCHPDSSVGHLRDERLKIFVWLLFVCANGILPSGQWATLEQAYLATGCAMRQLVEAVAASTGPLTPRAIIEHSSCANRCSPRTTVQKYALPPIPTYSQQHSEPYVPCDDSGHGGS